MAQAKANYIDPRNGKLYPLDVPRWCSDERTPLLVTPGAGIARDDINGRARSLWRYQAALPVSIANPITLGEGCTPLVQQSRGDLRPFFKLEWFSNSEPPVPLGPKEGYETTKALVDYPPPPQVRRAAIRPPTRYAIVVDGHFKTEFAEERAARKAATELLAK